MTQRLRQSMPVAVLVVGSIATGCVATPEIGLTEEQAAAAAREAAPHAADYPEVTVAEAGPFGEIIGRHTFDLDAEPAADRWVWQITLCEGCGHLSGTSTTVIIDYIDGQLYGVIDMFG